MSKLFGIKYCLEAILETETSYEQYLENKQSHFFSIQNTKYVLENHKKSWHVSFLLDIFSFRVHLGEECEMKRF